MSGVSQASPPDQQKPTVAPVETSLLCDPHPSRRPRPSPGDTVGFRLRLAAMSTTRARPRRTRLAAAVLAAGMGLSLAGCGGSAQLLAAPAATASAADTRLATPEVSTAVSVRTVSGRVSPADRARVSRAVRRVVDTWLDRAFVGGRYPRESFSGAFASFTPQAARRARGDRMLMTNAGVGARVEEVRALQRRVRLDLLAPGGRVAGVTAQFALRQALSGQVSRRELLTGELFLTRQPAQADRPGGWQVFGYEVRRVRL